MSTTTGLSKAERRAMTTAASSPGSRPILPAKYDGRLTFSLPETAKLLGIARGGLYRAALNNEIPIIRIGRRLLMSRRTLEDLLTSGNSEPAA
jgi:excisionase family DNA binding protein